MVCISGVDDIPLVRCVNDAGNVRYIMGVRDVSFWSVLDAHWHGYKDWSSWHIAGLVGVVRLQVFG